MIHFIICRVLFTVAIKIRTILFSNIALAFDGRLTIVHRYWILYTQYIYCTSV